MVLEFLNPALTGMFSFAIPPAMPPVLSVLFFSALISLVISVFNKLLVDNKKVSELKQKQKDLQEKAKALQKENPDEANKILGEVMSATNDIMKMNMKPMIPTMLFVILLLPWLGAIFTKPVAILPNHMELPLFGNDFGWLSWYFITSIPLSVLFRKALGVA